MPQETDAVPKHVLVVDDNVQLAQTFSELLQAHGYRVTLANDGVQALKLLNQAELHAIVCDLSMPQLEGDMFYNAAQHVRPDLTNRFIFVTGHADNPKYEAFLKKVEARVFTKPVVVEQLVEGIKEVVNGRV